MNVLSIQSHVAYGHVGNASAVFPMQRLGVEVWPVHTVQFSNHTGYGAWRGPIFEADMIRDVVRGIGERGVFPSCDAVLSGYMGSAEIGAAWEKRSNEGRDYLGLKLDDPSFTAPIYANLFQDEGADTYSLVWSRPNGRRD